MIHPLILKGELAKQYSGKLKASFGNLDCIDYFSRIG